MDRGKKRKEKKKQRERDVWWDRETAKESLRDYRIGESRKVLVWRLQGMIGDWWKWEISILNWLFIFLLSETNENLRMAALGYELSRLFKLVRTEISFSFFDILHYHIKLDWSKLNKIIRDLFKMAKTSIVEIFFFLWYPSLPDLF